MTDSNQITALERLTKLRENGALTDEEFTAQKAAILGSPVITDVPFYRRLWFVVLITCLLVTFPVALIILATGNVYKRASDGSRIPIGKTSRYVYASLLGLWLAALVVRSIINPNAWKEDWVNSVDTAAPSSPGGQQASNGKPAPDACESSDAEEMVKSAIENSATAALVHVKVLDYGHAKETYYDKQGNARYCSADAELNTGGSSVAFKLYYGPSGTELVEVKSDASGYDPEIETAKAAAATAAAQAAQSSQQKQAASAPTTVAASSPANSQTDGQCVAPNITKDMLYAVARAQVIANGYSPVPHPKPDDGSYCADSDHAATCAKMPEIEDCSADGYCKMSFSGKAGDTLVINIFGDGPDDAKASVASVQSQCKQ